MSSRRSVLDESPAFDPSLHRPMMPAGRSGSLTFVNLSSASSLFSNPSPPVSGGGPPHSGGGGAMMAPMSGGGSIGGMPPLMPNVVSPAAGHHPHHHQAQAAYPQQASPMGSWGFPTNAATSLQAPLQPAVLHQPHSQHHPHQQGMPTPMQPQPVYQPYQQQHPSMQPQAPFSLGGPPGSQGPYGHLPSPLQPTPVGGHPAAQHQQHLAYGGGMHYASPPTSHSSGGSPSHSSYSSPPSSTSSSSTSSPSPSSTSTMMAGGVGFGYGGGVGVGSAGGGNGSFRLDEAQERMRQQHEQIRAEERLKQQQLHVKMLQEEQQRHLREEQERERIEAEKRKAEREALRQEEERKRLEAQREQERQQEALRAEQMRIFEEVRQAQLRVQHEQELQHQRQQLEQFEQQQKVIQEQQRQQEQLRLERIRFEEEQKREEEAARLQQERVKQEEERKRQDLLRQEQLRQEQFALEQKRREEALQEKRRQEQLLLAQQEKLRREQEEVEQEKLRAEQRLNSERMQQEKERLAEEVRQQQERLRLAQEEIQREKEKMAIELMREQQRIQEERQRLQAEHEKLRQERMERERLEEESRVRHQERVRQHQEQLARQQEAIRQQQQQHVAHMRQQQEQMMRSQAQAQAQPQPQPQPQVSRTQTAPILSRRPTPQVPPVPTNASSWSPFGPSSSASSAEERPGEMKPRPRASVGSAILSRPPPHGGGTGSPNKASTLDSPFGGTSAAAGGGSAIHQRPISPPNAAQQGTRHPRKPRHPGAPAPIGALPGGQEQRIQADAMASYEAYAAEIARKHRVSDRAEIMTADTMFDSSAFENKLDLYEDHNEQRSAYYDDSSDDENGFYNGNKRSETTPPQPRSGSILGVRSPQQQQPAGRTLISHKTGPAATSGSAVPPKRVPKPMVALRTGPAGAPSHWEKDAGGVKAKDAPGARPLPSVPGDHNRRRSTGSAEGEDGDDDDNTNERNGGNAEKKGGLRALVKHHTGALKRSPRAPIYNDTEQQQQPPPQQHPRSAGFSHLNASVDSAHALIEELQEVTGHKEEGQPRSAPLPRVVRQLPTPSHTSPPPATPPRSASKSLPPVPGKNPPTAAGRQLPPKKAPLPPVPRKALSREEAALIFQTRWRSSRVRRQYTQITLRTRVAREIYSSELVYVQSLGVTIDVFLKPLRRAAEQSKPIILSADIASVFGNLEEIYAYHLQMVSKLESRITRWNVETQIGDTFLDMKQDFIMLYSSYINHYDQALETIGRCKDLKTWRAFIQRCNQHPECGGLSLESFLILPVQRVTRYVILLRDLRQKTPENHVDYQNINAAQTYMDNICYQVNENKRSAENLKKQMDVLASLQAKMKPKDMVRDLVDQNRVFVKQVVVTLYDQDSDKRREVCLFVFNDQLLVTKGDIKKDRFQIIAKFTRDDINFRLEIMADTDDFMEQLQKANFTEYYEVLEKKIDEFGLPVTPPQFLAAAIGGLLVVLFLLSVIFRGKKSGNSFLFVGLCGSGKTALMCLLKNGRVVETVTTMKENDVTCKLPSSGRQVHVVDFPGHQRLRSQLDTFLPITKGIVYLVDSVESRSQLTQNAQLLFDLFTNKTVNRRRTPILIACNKSEMVTAKRKEFIQGELEKELNHLRESSARGTLADIDGKKGGNVEEISLGAADEPFKMDQLPFKVSFAECSVKQGEVSAIEAFLSK